MTPSPRRAPLGLALLLLSASACGTRTAGGPVTTPPSLASDRQLLARAEQAYHAGRPAEAVGAYEQVARSSGQPALVRMALLQAGLLRVAEPSIRDVDSARDILQQAHAMYAPPDVAPVALSAVLALLSDADQAHRTASATETAAARELADRDQEIRTLRRTVTMLRQQVQKQEEALKKAAEAAVSPARHP